MVRTISDTKDVERSGVTVLQTIMHDIIKENSLRFNDLPDVDAREVSPAGSKSKYPDLILRNKARTDGLYLFEFKNPTWLPYDVELVEDAFLKASRLGIKFFGTCNFKKLIIWRSDLGNNVPLMDRHFVEYDLVDIRSLNDIRSNSIQTKYKTVLTTILKELEQIYFGKFIPKKKAIDAFFIGLLRTAIDSFYFQISEEIQDKYKKDEKFKHQLEEWFLEHNWNFSETLQNFEKVSKQYLLLLINKILFYNALKLHTDLKNIELKTKEKDADAFKKELNKYFDYVLKNIDYETIYSSNFIESIPLPGEIIPRLVSFINSLSDKYEFSKVNYDIMGRIFENLIPSQERHMLGQFFTNSNVVDLINAFCILNPNYKVLDPGCGAGTFLVRAYNLKKMLDENRSHEEIISSLYGFDISKFAAHLTNINISIKDLKSKESYPRIINDDFFNISPHDFFKEHYKTKHLSGALVNVSLPTMDAIVGNPPYTRQEELGKTFGEGYKNMINSVIKEDFGVNVSGQASVYVHFFIHGAKFLRDGGRFGFITANSWLDVGYGKELQKFLLDNFKIICIIESKVERFFEDAAVNTCITILEKSSNKLERDNHNIKFVELKKNISEFFPDVDATDDKESLMKKEKRRYSQIKKVIRDIENNIFEDDSIRVMAKKQSDLYNEEKWSKFIRAPKIFFDILENPKLIPLKQKAQIRFGVKTGDNDFFYLTKEQTEQYKIEEKYLLPIIFTLKEIDSYVIKPASLKYKFIRCNEPKSHLKGTNLLKYIEFGEKQKIDQKPTCKSRELWYSLAKNWETAPIIFPSKIGLRMPVVINKGIFEDKKLYGIIPNDKNDIELLCALLNSTIFRFLIEFSCRQLTGAQAIADIDVNVVENTKIIDPAQITPKEREKIVDAMRKISQREAFSIIDEIKMKDRLELDRLVFGILKIDKRETQAVYDSLIDLIQNRISKADNFSSKKDSKKMDEESVMEIIINEIDAKKLNQFPDDYLSKKLPLYQVQVNTAKDIEVKSTLTEGFHIIADGKIIKCNSSYEAEYIRLAMMVGKSAISLPVDENEVRRIVKERTIMIKFLEKDIKQKISLYTHDERIIDKLVPIILEKLLRPE